jgi:lysozyme family protein
MIVLFRLLRVCAFALMAEVIAAAQVSVSEEAICNSEACVRCEEGEMPLTEERKKEYDEKFASCVVQPTALRESDRVVDWIVAGRDRYERVAAETNTPWYVVGVIHNMECGGKKKPFACHLHNGDPLSARTVQVPKGRPQRGNPPFTWEQSAIDALRYHGFDVWRNWSVAGTLFKLEAYNGPGYRNRGVPSPYLWSGSQHYTSGKYVRDHVFDPNAVSEQIGTAVVLRRMLDRSLLAAEALRQ